MRMEDFFELIKRRQELRIGVALDLPGMGFLNAKTQEMQGAEVELGRMLARELFGQAFEPTFLGVDPGERIPSLLNQKADLVIAQLTITEERKELIDFSVPYFVAKEALLVLKESSITEFEDLNNQKIAVAEGSVTFQRFSKCDLLVKLIPTKTESGGIALLENRTVDAMANDDINLMLLLRSLTNSGKFRLVDIGEKFPSKYFGIGVRKNNPKLVSFLNESLLEYSRSGLLEMLFGLTAEAQS